MVARRHTKLVRLMLGSFGALLFASSVTCAQYNIYFKDKKPVKGWVVSDDGSKIKVRLDTGTEGTAVIAYKYEDLGARTIYRLMKGRTKADDSSGQLKLASYSLDNGLYMVARLHYRSAAKLDEKEGGKIEQQLLDLKKRAAGVVITRSRKLIAESKELQAEKDLALILKYLADTPEADEARKLLEGIAEKAMAKRQAKREELAQGKLDKIIKKLQGLRKNYDRAHENTRKGLLVANKSTQAIRLYESAIADFDKCLKALKKADKEVQGDAEFTSEVNAWITTITNDRIDTQLHIASAYFTRQTLTKALETVNKILADHPKNAKAMAMRERIEVAANDDPYGDGRARRGGRRR